MLILILIMAYFKSLILISQSEMLQLITHHWL